MNHLNLLLFLFLAFSPPAQEPESANLLELDEAIRIGLENNFGILIMRNRLEIASNNRTLGNAGFLPEVTLNGTRRESVEDSRFRLSGSDEINENRGARSTNTSAGVTLGWTLFDGMQMFLAYDRLAEAEELGRKELRHESELLVREIIDRYVDVVRVSEQLRVFENSLEVTEERIAIAETKLDLGSGSEYELLQARTDLNADRAAVMREQARLVDSMEALNELLARESGTPFRVVDDIQVNTGLMFEELRRRVLSDNISIRMADTHRRIADLELREIRSERYPELILNSGFQYSRTDAGGGFMRFNETEGFTIGVTARINLFDGFNTNRRVQNAMINRKNRSIEFEEQKLQAESELLRAYNRYTRSIELVQLEEDNLFYAEETLDIALERYRIGTISTLEFREAQRAFLSAESRLIDAKYEAKITETELLRLSGSLQEIAY
jgi:outer membrane protein